MEKHINSRSKHYQKWAYADLVRLKDMFLKYGSRWQKIRDEAFPTRTAEQIAAKFHLMKHGLIKKNKGLMMQLSTKLAATPYGSQVVKHDYNSVIDELKQLLLE